MSFDVTADLENGFVHLVYTGDVGLEERMQARDRVFEIRRNYELTRTLVETQNSNMSLSTTEIIQFSRTFPRDLPDDYHVAVVVAEDANVDILLEALASSAGLTIRAFKDRQRAINWLLAF
jgi:hypothetical protein